MNISEFEHVLLIKIQILLKLLANILFQKWMEVIIKEYKIPQWFFDIDYRLKRHTEYIDLIKIHFNINFTSLFFIFNMVTKTFTITYVTTYNIILDSASLDFDFQRQFTKKMRNLHNRSKQRY